MGILGFTWADAGAVVGAMVGGAVLGPAGAMFGGALATYAGATLGDGKSAGQAVEEAAVAGIGGAGGAWAADLGGKLVRDGIVRAAGKALSGSATRQVDRVASKVLLPWNRYEASPIAALGAGFAAYEASPQSRSSSPGLSSGAPVQVRTTDIGNGGCPIEMANLVMPRQLSSSVEKSYRELPGYLCGVWRSFGSGTRTIPAAPERPAAITGADRSGIDTYPGKIAELDASIAEFAALDRELAPLAQNNAAISARGQEAVVAVIARIDRGAATTPPPGPAADKYTLDRLDAAFAGGQAILAEARKDVEHLADRIDVLTRRIEKPGERVESGATRIDGVERRAPIMVPAPRIMIRGSSDCHVPQRGMSKSSRISHVIPNSENGIRPGHAPAHSSVPQSGDARVGAGVPSATPWTPGPPQTPKPSWLLAEPPLEPAPARAPQHPVAGLVPSRPSERSVAPIAVAAMSATAPAATAAPITPADRPRAAKPSVTQVPWSDTSPRPEPGVPWMPWCTWRHDRRSGSRMKLGAAVTIDPQNPQVMPVAWQAGRVGRSPCAERGAP